MRQKSSSAILRAMHLGVEITYFYICLFLQQTFKGPTMCHSLIGKRQQRQQGPGPELRLQEDYNTGVFL